MLKVFQHFMINFDSKTLVFQITSREAVYYDRVQAFANKLKELETSNKEEQRRIMREFQPVDVDWMPDKSWVKTLGRVKDDTG